MEKFLLKVKHLKLLTVLCLVVMLSSLNKVVAQIAGSTCINPIAITDIPFNHSGNTQDYGNDYSSSDVVALAPGAITTGTGNSSYLNDNEVVYELVAPSDGLITINTTNNDDWVGLWVFSGCPFSSTVGYHTAMSGTTRSIVDLPVTAGTSYYIVISAWSISDYVDYTINITGTISFPDCEGTPNPGNTISSVSSACPMQDFTLSLENYVGVGATYQWESADDINFTVNAENLGTNSTQITNISSAKYFRCLVTCTNSFEFAYSTPVYVSISEFINCYCIPPTSSCSNDQVASVVLGTLSDLNQTCSPVYADRSAEQNAIPDLTQGQTIEMSVGVSTGGIENVGVWIDFDQNGVFDEDEFYALGSGRDVIITNNIIIAADALPGNTKMRVRTKIGSAFTGSDACEVVGWGSTRDYLVNLTDPPTCLAMQNLQLTAVTTTAATITWDASLSAPTNGYQIYYNTTGVAPDVDAEPTGTVAAGITSFSTSNDLVEDTKYYFWVRSDCGGDGYSFWTGPLTVITTQEPATLPYIDDFATNQYSFINGTYTNQWAYGSATGNEANSIYISNNNGTSNAYDLSTVVTVVHAYRDIVIDSDVSFAKFSFDWKCKGESTYDYFRVWLVPTTYIPTAGTQITAEEGSGRIQIGENFNQQTTWQTYTDSLLDLTSFAGQTMRLVFEWRNDYSGGTQPPAAIDNVSLVVPDCVPPTNLQITMTALNSANVSWVASTSNPADGYDFYYNTTGENPTSTSPVTNFPTGTSFNTGETLEANTTYYIWIRSNCGSESLSEWFGPVTITTPLQVEPPWTEDFGEETTLPDGWTNSGMTLSSTNTPINSGGEASGVYIYKNLTGTSPANITGNFSTLVIGTVTGAEYFTFDYKLANASSPYAPPAVGSGNFVVEISTDFGNTWETIETVENNAVSGWQYKEYSIASYIGISNYVKFRITVNKNAGNHNYNIAFDNFNLASCLPVSQLTVDNITDNSAKIAWTVSTSSPGGYQVYRSIDITAPEADETQVVPTTEAFIDLAGLDDNTMYYVWVRSDCGSGDYSVWEGPINFKTTQIPAELPYSDNFETNQYELINGTQTNKWAYGSATGNPAKAIYISNNNGTSNAYDNTSASVVHAYRDISIPIGTSFVSFGFDWKAVGESTYDYLRVWMVPVSYLPTAGTQITAVAGSGRIQIGSNFNQQTTWQTYSNPTLDLTSFAGQTMRLVFEWRNDGSSGTNPPAAIDNVNLFIPACFAPTNLQATLVSVKSADLSWDASISTPGGYQMYYNTTGEAPDETTPASADLPATLTFVNTNDILEANTTYYVWMRTDCGSDTYSAWVGPATVTTPLYVPSPWSEGFDIAALPTGWTNSGMDFDNSIAQIGEASGNFIYKNLYGSATTGKFTTITVGDIAGTEDLSFDYKLVNYTATSSGVYDPPAVGSGNFVVEISTDFGDTWETIDTVENDAVAGWQNKVFPLTSYAGEYVKFRITANRTSGDYYIAFDNFNVASCLSVSNLSASDITESTATISWTASNSNPENYQVYVSLTNVAPEDDETDVQPANTNSIELTGLNNNPVHYIWVRANCGADDYSAWTGPLTLWTSCVPFEGLPYTENFDSYGTGSSAFPNCWSRPVTYNSYPYIVSAYSVSSPASLRFNSSTTEPTYAVSPAFAEDIHNLRVSFQLKAESTTNSGTIDVGVMSDPEDISTFETVATITPANINFNYYYYDLYAVDLTGSNNHIAFRHNSNSSSYYYWLDDFKVELSPSCVNPANLEANNITTNSVELSWTAIPTPPESGYSVYVSNDNTAPGASTAPTGTTNEASITINGLNPSTFYYAWVRANCTTDESSEWIGPIKFATLCAPVTALPYIENFDAYDEGEFPICWERPVMYNDFPSIVSPYSYFVSSPNSLKFQSLTTEPTYAVSPAFEEDIHNLRVSFQLKAESTSSSGTIDVGVMSDPMNINTFEKVATITPTNTIFNYYYYDLYPTTLSGADRYIAFRHNSNANNYFFWLDDFTVELSPSCVEPANIVANNFTTNSADLSWAPLPTPPTDGYGIYVSQTNTAPDASSSPNYTTTNAGFFTIGGLDPSTTYYVWLRTNCGGSEYSIWSGPTKITTTQIPANLPYTDSLTTNEYSFVNGTQTNKWAYGSATGNPANSIYISNNNGTSNAYVNTASTVHAYRDFTVPNDVSLVDFKFDWKGVGESTYDYLRVWLVSTDYIPTADEQITSGEDRFQIGGYFNQQSTWQTYHDPALDITSFVGQTMRLVFEWRNDGSVGTNPPAAVDNISIIIPDCVGPTNIEASMTSINSADITWNASTSNPENYNLYYNTTGQAPNDDTEDIITISGATTFSTTEILEANTTYYVWMRSDCGSDGYSAWVGPATFTTPLYVAPPWSEGFATATLPEGWTNSNMYLSASINALNTGGATGNYIYKNLSVSYPTGNFTTVIVGTIAGTETLSFDYKIANATSPYTPPASGTGNFVLEISTNLGETWTTIETVDNNEVAGWQNKAYPMSDYTGQYVTFRITANRTDGNYYIAFDNFNLANCLPVSNLSASSITESSATISWTASATSPENYQVYVSNENTAPTEGATYQTVPEATIDLNGLTHSTMYYVWVRTNCGESETSIWAGPFEFATLCGVDDIPYYQDFESVTAGEIPMCTEVVQAGTGNLWTTENAPGYGFTNMCLKYGFHGSNAANTWYFTNGINLEEGTSYRLTYRYGTSSTYSVEKLKVTYGTSASPVDVIATIVDNPNISNNVAAVQVKDFTPETSGVYYIGFNAYSAANQYRLFVDDISIELTPTCFEPEDLEIDGITANSANISWTEPATAPENGYDIYLSTSATAPTATSGPTNSTNETSFLFENLDEETNYYVWVRTNCNDGDQSAWAGPLHVYTGYCIPTNTSTSYWISSLTTTGGITNITHTGITSQPGGYGDFSATHSCSNVVGQPTTINFAQNTGSAYYYCWIDWNKDMQFDATERVIASTSSYEYTYQGTINIPAGTEPGEYRMRVANAYLYEITDACTGNSYGQFFDYTFSVVEPANDENDILTFSFPEQIAPANIDDVEHKVYITVESGTNLNGLVATFTLSPGASATVLGVPQVSGETPNNFTNTVIYTVTAENGDQQPWQVLVDVNVGIEDVENSALTIYPNPNNGNFTLDFNNINGKVNYQICDTKGSIIISDDFVVNGNAIKEVSLNLVPGVYYVKLITETQSLVEKLVVE